MAPGADHDSEHLLETFQATFWAKQIAIAEDERPDIKHAPLPLARIKKVMKSDPDVKVKIRPYRRMTTRLSADILLCLL